MRFLKYFFYTVSILAGLLVIVGLLLPDAAHVERSMFVDAPPARVFPLVNDFRQFNRWSPWAKFDPTTRYTFSGAQTGVGARMSWKSDHPSVGQGSQEIIASEADRHVAITLDFGVQGVATASYDLEPDGAGTKVTWGFDTEFGYDLVGRYIGLFFDHLIGTDYEQGLAALKELVEAEAPPD